MSAVVWSTKSWHYRFQNFFFNREDDAKDLCHYVRRVALSFFIAAFLTIVVLLVSFVLLAPFFYLTDTLFGLGEFFNLMAPEKRGAVYAGFFVWGLVFAGFARYKYVTWRDDRKFAKWEAEWKAKNEPGYVPPPVKEPSLLWTWITSLHSKVCFRIEFKN